MSTEFEQTEAASQLRAAGVQLKAGKSGKIRAATMAPNCALSDEQWALFPKLESLVRFEAVDCFVEDRHVKLLSQLPRLAQLDLTSTRLTNDAAVTLQQMKSLQLLKLSGTAISKDKLGEMRKSMLGTRIVFL